MYALSNRFDFKIILGIISFFNLFAVGGGWVAWVGVGGQVCGVMVVAEEWAGWGGGWWGGEGGGKKGAQRKNLS